MYICRRVKLLYISQLSSKYKDNSNIYFYIFKNSSMRRGEGFNDVSNFPYDSASLGTADIKKYYGVTLPNIIYNNDYSANLKNLTKTADLRQKNTISVLNDDWKKNTVDGPFDQRNAECENVGNGDQFNHLSNLAKSIDTSARLRCGWIYNKQKPQNSRGALGIYNGPLKSSTSGTWMWDLNKAKELMHGDICSNIAHCGDIDASIYKGRCGWCSQSGKAVPITNSSVAYPYNPKTTCPNSKISTTASKCPVKKEGFTSPVSCKTLDNGSLPRDCLLQKTLSAGCSDKGSLYQALRSGSDNDYLSNLRSQQAWTIYQNRATIPLDGTSLSSGKLTVADALNDFSRVQDQAASDANGGLQFAARDLCYNKGEMDTYDFCSEINDNTNGPFTLDCLQKLFMRMGGQTTGRKYPTASTLTNWNALGTWKGVKAAIQRLLNDTRSGDRNTQENAMLDFYGIIMQNKKTTLNPIKIIEASYGMNCNPALRGNRTTLFSNLADGKGSLDYVYDYTQTGGDPAHGCPKTLEVKYKCGDDENTITAPPEAGFNSQISIKCGPPPPCPSIGIPNVESISIKGQPNSSCLQLAQVVVKDINGKNVSMGRPTKTNGSYSPEANGNQAVDGIESIKPYPNIFHGLCREDRWEVKLDRPTAISSIKIYTRGGGNDNCCGSRIGTGFYVDLHFSKPSNTSLQIGPLTGELVQEVQLPNDIPLTAPLCNLQKMFKKAGCDKKLTENDPTVQWWRRQMGIPGVEEDMNAYGSLTKNCSGSTVQHEFCSPGKCSVVPPKELCKPPMGNPVDGAEYKYMGCFKDDHSRTITNYLGDTPSTEECWNRVKTNGFNVMGRQYFGQCFGGNNKDWNRLGSAGCCEPIGGGWTNQVFVNKASATGSSRKWDQDTQKAIDAFENTGWIPLVTWGTTPETTRRLGTQADRLLCPYVKEKYGSYDNMPAKYSAEANFCKANNL